VSCRHSTAYTACYCPPSADSCSRPDQKAAAATFISRLVRWRPSTKLGIFLIIAVSVVLLCDAVACEDKASTTAVLAETPNGSVPMTLFGRLGLNNSTLSFTAESRRAPQPRWDKLPTTQRIYSVLVGHDAARAGMRVWLWRGRMPTVSNGWVEVTGHISLVSSQSMYRIEFRDFSGETLEQWRHGDARVLPVQLNMFKYGNGFAIDASAEPLTSEFAVGFSEPGSMVYVIRLGT
jgi:hypothetical protein